MTGVVVGRGACTGPPPGRERNGPAPSAKGDRVSSRKKPNTSSHSARKIQAQRHSPLVAEYLRARAVIPFAKAKELAAAGIPWTAISAVCPVPMKIAVNRAGDQFMPDGHAGKSGWVFPVCAVDPSRPELIETDDPWATIRMGVIIDLVAIFSLNPPLQWALHRGAAVVLGAIPPQYLEPEPVRVHSDVGAWLRAGCDDGIVLLTRDLDMTRQVLGQISRIAAADQAEPAAVKPAPLWSETRLKGVIRKIAGAGAVQQGEMLRWGYRKFGRAVAASEMPLEVAKAILVKLETRGGLTETAASAAVESNLKTAMGEPGNAGKRSSP